MSDEARFTVERRGGYHNANGDPVFRVVSTMTDQDAAERAAANANAAEEAIDLLERFNRSCGADRISVEHEIGTFVTKRTFANLRKRFGGEE